MAVFSILDPAPSIGVHVKLNKIQTRTNLGHKPQWKKWRQIQNLLDILLKLFCKAKLKGLFTPIYSHSLEEKKVQEINTTGLFHIPFKLSNEPKTKKIQRTNFEKMRFQAFSFIRHNPI